MTTTNPGNAFGSSAHFSGTRMLAAHTHTHTPNMPNTTEKL